MPLRTYRICLDVHCMCTYTYRGALWEPCTHRHVCTPIRNKYMHVEKHVHGLIHQFARGKRFIDMIMWLSTTAWTLFWRITPKHLNKHVHSRVCIVDAGWPYAQRNQTRRSRNHNVLFISCNALKGVFSVLAPQTVNGC